MMYQKPQVEIIRFEENSCFMTYSSNLSQGEGESAARAAAMAAMGWSSGSTVTAQKGSDGKWMAYCTWVNGNVGYSGQYTCTSF